MKKLSQFLKFDFNLFSEGKMYRVIGFSEWLDYQTKAHLGTKIETVIAKDQTPYKQKEGETVTNLYEKLVFKIKKDVKVPVNSYIMPVNAVAVVYGDYRNNLSVTADDIRVIPQK